MRPSLPVSLIVTHTRQTRPTKHPVATMHTRHMAGGSNMLLVVTLLLIYLADLVASIREDGGDIGLLGFSVQSLLPSEVVQPRLKEDKDGERGMSSLLFTIAIS